MKVVHDPRALFATSRELWLWPIVIGLGCLFFTVTGGSFLLRDPDTWSHIALGRWIIEHRALPFQDPFSYTFQGKLWVPEEWLSDIIFASTYKYFGWAGVCAIPTLSITIALVLLTRRLMYWLEPLRAAFAAAFAFALLQGHLLARPHLLAIPILVFWVSNLVSAREEERAPSFIILPMMTLWCNLHGSFIVGLAFCVLLGLEAVYASDKATRWEVAGKWGFFTICALASAALSPNGAEGLFFPVRVVMLMNNEMAQVGEWKSPDFHTFQPLELWIGCVILAGYSLGLRLPVTRILMVLLLLHEALVHARNAELLGFVAPFLVAPSLSRQLQPGPAVKRQAFLLSKGHELCRGALLAIAIAIFFVSSVALFNWRGVQPSERFAPRSALEAARSMGVSGRVFNDYNFGSYLIFEGVPTFIDGRAQPDPFTHEFMAEAFSALNGSDKALTSLLNQYDVDWTLLRPKTAAVGLLDHLQNWKRVYADDYAVVHRRIR